MELDNMLVKFARAGKLEIVKKLVETGANPDNDRALACARDHIEVVEYLNDANVQKHLDNSLKIFAKLGKLEIVKFLVEAGANPNIDMSIVANRGYLEVVKHLVSKGADINANEAINYAAFNGHLNIVRWMLDAGADATLECSKHLVANVCMMGDLNLLKRLDKMEAVVSDNPGAFKMACERGHLEIVKYLVERGNDVHVDDDWGLRIALGKENTEVVEYLKGIK